MFVFTLQRAVFVLDVFPDGAAGKDGRLQPGDEIIDLCQQPFKAVEYERARQAVLKIPAGTVRLFEEIFIIT